MVNVRWDDATTWPSFQLCKGVDSLPTGPEWIFEKKLDGVRVMASSLQLRLRNIKWDDHGIRLPNNLAIPDGHVLDCEMVRRDGQRMIPAEIMSLYAQRAWDQLMLIPFDCLMQRGFDLWDEPLSQRHRFLKRWGLPEQLKVGEQIPIDWEGVVGKRLDMPYQSGRQWLKMKNWWLMDAICTDLQYRAGNLVTCTFALQDGDQLVEIGKATVNDVNANLALLVHGAPMPIVVRHFGITPNGVRNPHVILVKEPV